MNDCWTKVEKRLREKFDEYRRLNLFTDVTLIVKNGYGKEVNFPVHRIILSAISPYFEKMFSTSMIESVAKEIPLKDIDAESMRVIISVAYCGIIDLNRANVRGVLLDAEYLGIDFLVKKCTKFYAKQLEMDNNLVVEIRNLHHTHGHIASLKLAIEKSNKYIKKNFEHFLKSVQFVELNIDDVVDILSWNGVCTVNEEPIFNAAIRWIEKDSKMRHQFAKRVISTVRLPQLPQNFLTDVVSKNKFVKESEELNQMITGAIASSNAPSGHSNRIDSSWATRKEVYVFSLRGIGEHIMKFTCANNEWTQMDLPAALTGRKWFGLAGHGKKLFLIGDDNSRNARKCTSFDIITGNVIELRKMLEPRSEHCAIALGNSIFAFGGWNRSYVERYDIERDEWLRFSAMHKIRKWPAGVALDNVIYAIGGWGDSQSFNTVERFDPRVGTWEYVVPMSNLKSGAGAAVLNGKIYVAGGYNGSHLNTVEIYDHRANKWTAGPSMTNARAWHELVSDGNRLLSICGKGTGGNDLDSVEIFDGGDQWTMTEAMPSIYGYVKAAIL